MKFVMDLRSYVEDKTIASDESLFEDSDDNDDKTFSVNKGKKHDCSFIVESDENTSEETDYSDTASESDNSFDSFVKEIKRKNSNILKNISKVDGPSFEEKQRKFSSKSSLKDCFNGDDEYSTESEIQNSDINIPSKKKLKFKRRKLVGVIEDSDSEVLSLYSSDTKKINSALNSGDEIIDAKILENSSYFDNVLEVAKKDDNLNQPSSSQKKQKLFHKCFKCNKKYLKKSKLETHCLSHLIIKPYSCLFCVYETSYKSRLKRHKHLHPEYKVPLKKLNLVLEKDKCIATLQNEITSDDVAEYASPNLNINHSDVISDGVETSKDDLSFDANLFTDSKVNNIDKLSNHLKKLKCYLCSFSASTNFAVNKHYDKKHPSANRHLHEIVQTTTNEKGVRVFLCPKCRFSTCIFRGWLSHYSKTHTDGDQPKNCDNLAVYSCKICPFKTVSFTTWLHHKNEQHRTPSKTSYSKIRSQK